MRRSSYQQSLGMNLLSASRFARVPAHLSCCAGNAFANSEKFISIKPIVKGTVPSRMAMYQYRYPSPSGRSGRPKARPSALGCKGGNGNILNRRFLACGTSSQEPFAELRVMPSIHNVRGVTERCVKQKFLPSHWSDLQVSQPAVTRSANRLSWAALPASVQQLSLAAMPARALLSEPRQTSRTARAIRARVAPSTDLISIRRIRPAVQKSVKPRCSAAAAGFLRTQSPRNFRGHEPGRD